MKHLFALTFLLLAAAAIPCHAAEPEEDAPETVDEVRTQSGVDPTRVTSKLGFSTWIYDREANNMLINNRVGLTSGIGNWSFNIRLDMVSLNTLPGRNGYVSGIGNLKTTILNAFYNDGRHALAASIGLSFPTASQIIDDAAGLNSYFSMTPALTYTYTINPSLILALQPQYAFSLSKGEEYFPDMSVFTMRIFIAKFWDSGMFFVFEPRPIYDFYNKQFDMILSPIVGRTLGGGYTLSFLAEIPVKERSLHKTGVLYLLGISKTF